MENNEQSFWQFSDQLRLQTTNLANLSVNDSIWSNPYVSKRVPQERKNFDIRVGGHINSPNNSNPKQESDHLNANLNDGWNSFKPTVSSDLNTWAKPPNKSSDHLNMFNDRGWSGLKPSGPSDLNGLNDGWNSFKNAGKGFDYINGFNDGWKIAYSAASSYTNGSLLLGAGGYQKGNMGNHADKINDFNLMYNLKEYNYNYKNEPQMTSVGKKSNANKKKSNNKMSENKVDKKLKTLPASESLPMEETLGGYIFVCNNDTMQDNLKRQLFGLPPRYRDSVRSITPGMSIFLYNYSTHQLHGIFTAVSFGGMNIDPSAWEDKKCPGESRFPAQVQVVRKEICEPLEEDTFRPVLHHYDGPKFRLELSISETLSLLDVFAQQQNSLTEFLISNLDLHA